MSVTPAYLREWRKNHPENIQAHNAAYWQKNKDTINAKRRKGPRAQHDKTYRERHKTQCAAAKKAWCKAHPEKVAESNRKWREAHKEQFNAYHREYARTHKREQKGVHAQLAKAKQILIKCDVCGREFIRRKPEQVCCSRACGAARAARARRAARRTRAQVQAHQFVGPPETQGIASWGLALPPKPCMDRIERVCRLVERREQAVGANDRAALLSIAAEYRALKMPIEARRTERMAGT